MVGTVNLAGVPCLGSVLRAVCLVHAILQKETHVP